MSASGVAPGVTGLDLLDADTGALIASLMNNDTLDLNALGRRAFRVRANLSGSGSVQFQGNGIEYITNSAHIMGVDWLPAPGTCILTATPWSGADATGEQGSTDIVLRGAGAGGGRYLAAEAGRVLSMCGADCAGKVPQAQPFPPCKSLYFILNLLSMRRGVTFICTIAQMDVT